MAVVLRMRNLDADGKRQPDIQWFSAIRCCLVLYHSGTLHIYSFDLCNSPSVAGCKFWEHIQQSSGMD